MLSYLILNQSGEMRFSGLSFQESRFTKTKQS